MNTRSFQKYFLITTIIVCLLISGSKDFKAYFPVFGQKTPGIIGTESVLSIEPDTIKLEIVKEDVESIDKIIKQTIPDTNFGFNELSRDQLVAKNGQVIAGMDIYYWKRKNELREKIIFHQSPAPSELVFQFNNFSLKPVNVGKGVWYFADKKGNSIFRITKGYIKDLTGAFSNDIDTIIKDNKLIHTLDPVWLSDPVRVYPLTLYLVDERFQAFTPALKEASTRTLESLPTTEVTGPANNTNYVTIDDQYKKDE